MMTGSAETISRRDFLSGRPQQMFRPLPPGADAASLAACTGCGDCVEACPEAILRISDHRVIVDFTGGECSFCGACAEICDEAVFTGSAVMHHRIAIAGTCLARRGVTCMTCRDACPEAAIRFRPRIGGPFLPELDPFACTGCGACIAPCPADAISAAPEEVAHA